MKYLKIYGLPLFVILLSLFLFLRFRIVPSSKLWDSYSVFYVPVQSDKNIIKNVLEETGCKDVIMLENQYVPIDIKLDSPEMSLALSSLEKSDYLKKRSLYFFDKNKQFSIYYIPEKYSKNANVAIEQLKQFGIDSAMNVKSHFPIIVPILTVILCVILFCFSKNKFLCGILFVLPIIFSFCVPSYSASCALFLFVYVVFVAINLWQRKNALSVLKKNIFLMILLAVSFITMIFSSIKAISFFVLLILSECAVLVIVRNLKNYSDSYYHFKSVKIIGANFISLKNKKNNVSLLVCASCVFLIAVFSFFSSFFLFNSSSKKNLNLPGQTRSFSVLPNLNDFIAWRWEVLTFPYISVNSSNNVKNSQNVSFLTFKRDGKKIISEKKSIDFDLNFAENSIASIDDLNFPAIEKLLKVQKVKSASYVSAGAQKITVSTYISIILCLLVTLYFYFMQKYDMKNSVVGLKNKW